MENTEYISSDAEDTIKLNTGVKGWAAQRLRMAERAKRFEKMKEKENGN